MPRNGAGLYTPPYDWEDDDANDIPIRSDRMQGQDQDMADALTASIAKDGQTTPTANLPMGGFKHTGVAVASSRTDYLRASQAQDNDLVTYTASGTDTYSITPAPAVTSYTTGQAWMVLFTNANTGAATLNVSGLGAKDICKATSSAVVSGDITAGMMAKCVYDGTRFQIQRVGAQITTLGLTAGVAQTAGFTAAVNTKYVCNFTAAVTITLPASATAGDIIVLAIAGGFEVTLNPNGLKINASTANLNIGADMQTVMIMYTGATNGWV